MRILLTCHVRFASAMAWYTLHLARGLRLAGHEVYLSSQKNSPLSKWAQEEELDGDSDHDFHSANPVDLLNAASRLKQIIANFKPHVLNPHCPPGHALLAFVNKGKLPLIRTVAEPRPPKAHFINKYLHERKTDGMIYSTYSSLSRYSKAFKFGETLEKVILPGLDLTLFPPVPTEDWRVRLGIPENALFGAIVARMNPEKGQELLIDALALLPESERVKIVVLLTGDDNQQRTANDIKTLAENKGVTNSLRFQSRLSDVRPLLAEIDLGIITSVRSEAVCRIALEYMAFGKPILSTNVNILNEVVHHKVNGWSVPHTDAQMIADSLSEAIRNRGQLIEMGKRGRELLLSRFTLEKMTSDTLSFYREVEDNRKHVH